MDMDKWILEGREARKATLDDWAAFWGKGAAARRVGLTEGDEWTVSTVFLGMDHRFDDGPPLLFETMVFSTKNWRKGRGLSEHDMDRYSTWDEAEAGHARMVEKWIGT